MKKSVYLFAFFLITSTFITAPVMAQDLPCNGNNPYGPCGTTGSTNLPINNGIVYLFIIGLMIGVVALRKLNSAAVKA